jgi:hypothetical protein
MPTEYLYVIPASPKYVPTADVRELALEAFKDMLPGADSVDAVVQKEVSFIDSGVRFEQVSCHFCGSALDQIWWGDAMNAAHKTAFNDLKVQLPCCDATSNLNDLHYKMPSGFARFHLKARWGKLGQQLPVDKMRGLETILDTPLKQIWAQYREVEEGQVRIHSRKGVTGTPSKREK